MTKIRIISWKDDNDFFKKDLLIYQASTQNLQHFFILTVNISDSKSLVSLPADFNVSALNIDSFTSSFQTASV